MALDLDGTLLDPAGNLPATARNVLRRLAAAGVRIVLASGRMTAAVIPVARALGIPVPLVTYNGAVVLEAAGDGSWSIIAKRVFPDAARDAVFGLCRTRGVFLNVYSDGRLYGFHRDGDFAWSAHYETNAGARYAAKTANLEELPRQGIEKLLVMSDPAGRDRLHGEWAPLVSAHCDLAKSNPEYLEFMAKGVTKGSALAAWLEREALRSADLIAFGDAENDAEMLGLAGLGLAMANATPGLRAAHRRFTRWSNAEDGVARELCDRFGLDYAACAADY